MGRGDNEWTNSWDNIAGVLFFFFKTCKTNSLGFFFFVKGGTHITASRCRKGSEEDAGRQRSQQVLVETRVSQHFREPWKGDVQGADWETLSIQSSSSEKSGFCWEEDTNCLLGQTALSLVGSCAGQTELKDLGGLRKFLPEMAGCPQTILQKFCVSRSFLPYKTREVTR